MALRRLGLVVAASSTGVWDVVSYAPDDVEVIALFARGDTVWSDLRESLSDDLHCIEVDAATDLRPLDLTGICTFADEQLVLTAQLAAGAGLRFHGVPTAAALTDKGRQRELLSSSAVGVRHRVVATVAEAAGAVEELAVPCILKPLGGWASRGVVRLDPGTPPGELDLPAVVEELVVHQPHPRHPHLAGYVSVESVVVDGVRRHLAVTGRLPVAAPFRESGAVLPADLPPAAEERALTAVDTAFDLLGVDQGTLHTELVLDRDRWVVIEVNGRLGGFVDRLARTATGSSLLERSLCGALGETPDALPEAERVATALFLHPADEPVVQEDPVPVAELRAIPGVVEVQVRTHRGAVVDPSEGTAAAVAHCYLVTPDVAALAPVAAQVRQTLSTHTRFRPVAEAHS